MLSSRLNAWQTPANQTVATSVCPQGSAVSGFAVSENTRNAPMISDETSLASGDNWKRSSRMPTMNMATAAKEIETQAVGGTLLVPAATTLNERSVARTIAIPPIVGVGALCHRSVRGTTMAPRAGAVRLTRAQNATQASVERANASGSWITLPRRYRG